MRPAGEMSRKVQRILPGQWLLPEKLLFPTCTPFDIAERVRKIGGTTIHSIGHIARSQLQDNDAEYVSHFRNEIAAPALVPRHHFQTCTRSPAANASSSCQPSSQSPLPGSVEMCPRGPTEMNPALHLFAKSSAASIGQYGSFVLATTSAGYGSGNSGT